MVGISLVTVPVLVDINSDAAHLLSQWARMYGYGIQLMPAGAMTTTLLYGYLIFSKRRLSQPWHLYAVAALATISIVPYTRFVMLSTNNILFELDDQNFGVDLMHVQELVEKWRQLHIGRSMLPMVGAVVGMIATLQEAQR